VNDRARKAVLPAPARKRETMKYICLGYIEPGKFEGMTEDQRLEVFDACFEHNDHLRSKGHLVREMSLQPPETAVTLRGKNGKVVTTDGPYAETKEQLGGLMVLEAQDLNHAIQLISQLPGFKYGLGPIEIRPVADLSELVKASEQRRRQNAAR
jgi:hypothetical protein